MATATHQPSYKFSLEYIGKTEADHILDVSGGNRRLRPGLVKRYAESLVAGRWNNEAPTVIVIDENGQLRDGQHRLNAISVSGVGAFFIVCTGVRVDAFSVLDTGARRSAGDVLSLRGVQYATIVASASRYALNYIEGTMIRKGRDNDEIDDFARLNPGIESIAARSYPVYKQFGPSPFAAVLYLASTSRSTHKRISDFIDGVRGQADVAYTAGDPRRLLRDWAQRELSRRKHSVIRPEPLMMATSIAWNAFATGNSLSSVSDLNSKKTAHRDTMPIVGFTVTPDRKAA